VFFIVKIKVPLESKILSSVQTIPIKKPAVSLSQSMGLFLVMELEFKIIGFQKFMVGCEIIGMMFPKGDRTGYKKNNQ
jgi:hypothetical protein